MFSSHEQPEEPHPERNPPSAPKLQIKTKKCTPLETPKPETTTTNKDHTPKRRLIFSARRLTF